MTASVHQTETLLFSILLQLTVMTGPLLKLLLPRVGHAIPVGVEA